MRKPSSDVTRQTLAKVPEITLLFWVLKLLTTGMGEAMSDFLGQHSVPIAAAIGIFGMLLALRLQLRQTEYRAPYYWFAVMMVAVFGTMAADGIHDGAGIGYGVTTPLFAQYVQLPLMTAAPAGSIWETLTSGVPNGANILTASIILAVMILPYMAAVLRDLFNTVPQQLRESGYGMGSTPLEVVSSTEPLRSRFRERASSIAVKPSNSYVKPAWLRNYSTPTSCLSMRLGVKAKPSLSSAI